MAWSTGNPRSGAPNGSSLGLSTGKTWSGNTAYGPSGGMAAGYATQRNDGSYGNFRSLRGEPMSGPYGQVTGPAPRFSGEHATANWNYPGARMPGGWNPAGGITSAIGAALGAPAAFARGLAGLGDGFMRGWFGPSG